MNTWKSAAALALLGLLAAATARSEEFVQVGPLATRLQSALSPSLQAWVAAQADQARRSLRLPSVTALQASAQAALPASKASRQNAEAMVFVALAEWMRGIEQDIARIAQSIEASNATRKGLREAARAARGALGNAGLAVDGPAWARNLQEARRIEQMLDTMSDLSDSEQQLAFELQARMDQLVQALIALSNLAAKSASQIEAVIASLKG